MQKIKKYVDRIDEELNDAKTYAECYLDYKSRGNINSYPTFANRYKEMATQELQHSMYLHDMAVIEIEELRKGYTPPSYMEEIWDKSHKKYIEKTAWIKQMLAM